MLIVKVVEPSSMVLVSAPRALSGMETPVSLVTFLNTLTIRPKNASSAMTTKSMTLSRRSVSTALRKTLTLMEGNVVAADKDSTLTRHLKIADHVLTVKLSTLSLSSVNALMALTGMTEPVSSATTPTISILIPKHAKVVPMVSFTTLNRNSVFTVQRRLLFIRTTDVKIVPKINNTITLQTLVSSVRVERSLTQLLEHANVLVVHLSGQVVSVLHAIGPSTLTVHSVRSVLRVRSLTEMLESVSPSDMSSMYLN